MTFKTHKIKGLITYANLFNPISYDQIAKKPYVDYEDGAYRAVVSVEQDAKNNKIVEDINKESGLLIKEYQQSTRTSSNELKLVYPIEPETNENGALTGRWRFRFKRKAKNKAGQPAKIRFYDVNKKPITLDNELGKGSEVLIKFSLVGFPYKDNAGNSGYNIMLCIQDVQILKFELYSDTSWMEDEEDAE